MGATQSRICLHVMNIGGLVDEVGELSLEADGKNLRDVFLEEIEENYRVKFFRSISTIFLRRKCNESIVESS